MEIIMDKSKGALEAEISKALTQLGEKLSWTWISIC